MTCFNKWLPLKDCSKKILIQCNQIMYSNLQKCWKVTHVIIGPQNAGKSLFFEHLKNDPLDEEHDSDSKKKKIITQTSKFSNGYNRGPSTVGMDFGIRHISIDGQPVTLQLYDTAG